MRRIYDRQRPTTLFRGGERGRLMVMMAMLMVLAMMIAKARDPGVWRWFTGEAAPELADAREEPAPKKAPDPAKKGAPAVKELLIPGPTDLDPDERETAERLYEGISDQEPLDAVEMLPYWRQMRWTLAQSYAELEKRAIPTVRFADLFHAPEQYRGKIFKLRLHLRQVVMHDKVEEAIPGVSKVYQVVGWNDESQPYSYWLVCPEIPAGMPQGPRIHEEGTFVGYFLKQTKYEDHEGKQRATPILIGRLKWQPTRDTRVADVDADLLVPLVIGGGVLVLAVVFGGMWLSRRNAPPRRTAQEMRMATGEASNSVESWLEAAESDSPDEPLESAINQPPPDDGMQEERFRRMSDRPDWPPL